MTVYVVFSALSITLILPFLDNIFTPQSSHTEMVTSNPLRQASSSVSVLSWENKIQEIRDRFKQKLFTVTAGGSKKETLYRLCILLFFGFLIKNIFSFGQGFFSARVEQGVMRDLRQNLFAHLQCVSLDFYHKQKVGILVSRVTNDVSVINASITAVINSFSRDPFLILIYLTLMFLMSWKLTLLSLIIVPLFGLIIAWIGSSIKKYSIRSQERMADMASILIEGLSGIRIIKAFSAEKHVLIRFMKEADRNRIAMTKKAWAGNASSPLNEILGVSAAILILWVGGQEMIKGSSGMSAGSFFLFLFAMFSIIQPLKYLSQVWVSFKEGSAAAERIFSVLDVRPGIVNSEKAVEIPVFKKEIRFEDVGYAYEEKRWVLQEISGVIPFGSVIALVGPSGAGKSTLADLLIRFYDPQKGRITLDGTDLREIRLESLRKLISVVTQETILFHDTIWNNIVFGMEIKDVLQVKAAAKAANADDFISTMPKGYETVIGDRGVKLSGGQRQRLAIARAILRDPPIVILDEATSSLDTESERLVQESLDRLMHNRTVFVVAHRLSTIVHADEIWVMEEGKITGRGTHHELLSQSERYKRLYEMQFKAS
jgi:subfamily B ATP-binding cassette protein MsbA